jgi:hypothetical protein
MYVCTCMPASPVLFGMVESGRYWRQKKNKKGMYMYAAALRNNVENQVTDFRTVDKITENAEFFVPSLTAPKGVRCLPQGFDAHRRC